MIGEWVLCIVLTKILKGCVIEALKNEKICSYFSQNLFFLGNSKLVDKLLLGLIVARHEYYLVLINYE
jgi:hypothetical protein